MRSGAAVVIMAVFMAWAHLSGEVSASPTKVDVGIKIKGAAAADPDAGPEASAADPARPKGLRCWGCWRAASFPAGPEAGAAYQAEDCSCSETWDEYPADHCCRDQSRLEKEMAKCETESFNCKTKEGWGYLKSICCIPPQLTSGPIFDCSCSKTWDEYPADHCCRDESRLEREMSKCETESFNCKTKEMWGYLKSICCAPPQLTSGPEDCLCRKSFNEYPADHCCHDSTRLMKESWKCVDESFNCATKERRTYLKSICCTFGPM